MAPERFRGQADARSDVYALGVTLYELLTLKPAYGDADRPRLIERVTRGAPPPRPSAVEPLLPRDLETVVLKAMAREPADRYRGAADLAADLRRFLDGRPVKARRHSWREQTWRWAKRNPAVASLLGVVGVLLLVVAVGSLVKNAELSRKGGELRQALTESEANRRDADEKLFGALVAQAKAVSLSQRPGRRFGSLRLVDEARALARRLELSPDKLADLRNTAVAALAVPDLHPGPPIGPWPDDAAAASFTADLTVYARTDRRGR